ncbi:putative toxin-antitoxin system toxin component, PIN family [Candidatus Woesearchaeota archaeon]|nr:putative toxin-antitoxin system toxin component, PIN family [Candidatus Woesearchaeota archaeon]
MRVVLDTNVFISGIFWEGNFCSQIINKWKEGKFQLISSEEIIEELVKTLKTFKISMDKELIEEWKNLILENSIMIDVPICANIVKEDPEDDKFIWAAVYGQVDFIISQDKHLLKLKEYENIKILTPEEAIRVI